MTTDELIAEIKSSQIRSEVGISEVLKHITFIQNDLEKIKANLSEHTKEIVVTQSDYKHLSEKVAQNSAHIGLELNKVWDRLRDSEKTAQQCREDDLASIPEIVKSAKKDVMKDVKIWIFTMLASFLTAVVGGAVAVGVLIQKVNTLEKLLK